MVRYEGSANLARDVCRPRCRWVGNGLSRGQPGQRNQWSDIPLLLLQASSTITDNFDKLIKGYDKRPEVVKKKKATSHVHRRRTWFFLGSLVLNVLDRSPVSHGLLWFLAPYSPQGQTQPWALSIEGERQAPPHTPLPQPLLLHCLLMGCPPASHHPNILSPLFPRKRK